MGRLIRLLTPTQRPGGPSRRTTCRQETSPRTTTWPLRTLTFPADAIWSATKKNGFSTDSENLNPTTRSFNSSKAHRTPDQLTGIAEGIIDTGGEKCDYATQHDEVKDKYNLTMTEAEEATVDEWLALCP